MAISRDYTKEVGLPSQKKTMSRPLAVVVLALVVAGVSYGVVEIQRHAKVRHVAETAASAPAAAAAPANGAAPASP